jgi:bifunctional DNA-binding transcriptional regulator/antitoxin component of YhaV-PrlF toxin-antitoxin module
VHDLRVATSALAVSILSPRTHDQAATAGARITWYAARRTKYAVNMEAIQQYLVSTSGQMSIPAAVRHRWHLDQGGPVDVIDLGFGVLTVPAGEAQRLLGDLLSRDDHAAFVRSLEDDPDLATT